MVKILSWNMRSDYPTSFVIVGVNFNKEQKYLKIMGIKHTTCMQINFKEVLIFFSPDI